MEYKSKMLKVKALKEVKTVPKKMFHASHESNEYLKHHVIGVKCRGKD